MALPPGTRLGVYQVLAQIGEGGMGQVYRGADATLGRQVAIKVLPDAFAADAERVARFAREAKTLASLNHPHIAAIYGFEKFGSTHALVMELVEGDDLSQRLARGAIPLDEALPIAKQIAGALEAAHEQGIIHRDLKPANVKVRADGTVKVLDFGLAKALGTDTASAAAGSLSMSPTITTPAMTQLGMILGTAAYMSPEQAKGRPADRRSDVWAFGCVLYEMLAGRRAFAGDDVSEVLASLLAREPDWAQLPPTLSPGVGACIRRCLQKDPKQRFGDMQSARLALDGAFESAVTQPAAGPPSTNRRERWLWAGALVVAAAVAAAAARFAAPSPEPPPTIRFTASPPAGLRLSTGVGASLAVSPDGRYVILSTVDTAQAALFVRALNDDTLRELPGTGGASLFFWAPDSRGIAFFANGLLKRTDQDGAPVQTVGDAPAAQGGTWAPDGTLLVGSNAGPLRRVPASGGALVEMTKLDQSRKETSHRHPTMLPDGRHFLYFAAGVQPGGSIYAGSLDDDSKTLVLASDSNAEYLDGYLLFTRGGTLLAQPFDATSLRVSGDAVAIARDIWLNPTVAKASFSGAGSTLAFRVATPSAPTQLTWLDRSGKELEKVGEPADQTSLELSPDGTRLLLSIFDPARQTRDLWIQDLKRGVRTRFTFGPNEDLAAVWSPDGQRLAFSSIRTDVLDLFSQAADGTGIEELVAESTDNKYPNSWSNDGQLLLFHTGNARSRTGNDLWVLPLGQKQKPRVFLGGTFNETGGRFSPDGRWVSYQSGESGRAEVYVVPYPGPGGKWQISVGGGFAPRWNPNGRELLYLANGTTIMSVTVDGSGTAFQASTPQKLFETRLRNENYRGYGVGNPFDISPDGQRILANIMTNAPTAPDAVTVVTNWTSLVRR